MKAKELGHFRLCRFSLRDAEHQSFEVVRCRRKDDPIQVKKHDSSSSSNAFVAVDEWMIGSDVEQVCSRHLVERRVKILSSERRLWLSNCRDQKADISNARTATVPRQLIAMNLQNFVEREENRLHHLFRQATKGVAVLLIRPP